MNQNQQVARERVVNQVNEMRKCLDEIEEQMKIRNEIEFESLENSITSASNALHNGVNDCYSI